VHGRRRGQRPHVQTSKQRQQVHEVTTFLSNHFLFRFISQRQYKRKIKREDASSAPSYVTMERKTRRKHSAEEQPSQEPSSDTLRRLRITSKTTYRLRPVSDGENAAADPAPQVNAEDEPGDQGEELMEIPLSPTHYDQPPTPEHDPPTPWQAETQILKVIGQLKEDAKRSRASRGTEVEKCFLLPPGVTEWPPIVRRRVSRAVGPGGHEEVSAGEPMDAAPTPEPLKVTLPREDFPR